MEQVKLCSLSQSPVMIDFDCGFLVFFPSGWDIGSVVDFVDERTIEVGVCDLYFRSIEVGGGPSSECHERWTRDE